MPGDATRRPATEVVALCTFASTGRRGAAFVDEPVCSAAAGQLLDLRPPGCALTYGRGLDCYTVRADGPAQGCS